MKIVNEEFVPNGGIDLASPAALITVFERLLMTLPSGWSMTGLELYRDADAHWVLRMSSEPLLAERIYEAQHAAKKARAAADEAVRRAERAEDTVDRARANHAAALDESRPPADGGPRTVDVAGFVVDPRRVVVND